MMMLHQVLLSMMHALFLANSGSAFPFISLGWVSRSTYRNAITYGPDRDSYGDGYISPTLTWLDDEYSTPTIVEAVSEKCMPSLAKVACGFAPDGHGFRLQDIDSVYVVDVDESHIELSAVLCEDIECVTVAVDVDFPHACAGDDGLELCIIDNMNELDGMATHKMRNLDWGHENEKGILAQGLIEKALIQNDQIGYPSWWIQPISTSLVGMPNECSTIRSLLNEEDFQQEIRALCTKVIGPSTDATVTVEKAGVAVVGPAGMILRGYARHGGMSPEDDGIVLEVPVPFDSEATSVDELRSLVLKLVEEVEEA